MNPSSADDRILLEKCLSNDRQAMELVVRRFSDLVYRSAQQVLISKDIRYHNQDLEDLHNHVFLLLFEADCKKLRQYKGKNGCSLASWIRMVSVSSVLNCLRKKGVDAFAGYKFQVALDSIPDLQAESGEVWSGLEKKEQERLLGTGIDSLSPRDQLFMKLHFRQGLSVPETAEFMGLSIQNAHTLKHRAVQRLKTYVDSALDRGAGE